MNCDVYQKFKQPGVRSLYWRKQQKRRLVGGTSLSDIEMVTACMPGTDIRHLVVNCMEWIAQVKSRSSARNTFL